MQYTVALDLSEKPGWAIFLDGKLQSSGTIFQTYNKKDLGKYPHNYRLLARFVSEQVIDLMMHLQFKPHPINVVIEETTASSQNYSQKILEFIHYEVISKLAEFEDNVKIHYIRDGVWKRICGATQSKAERNWNARISRYKKKHDKKIAKLVTEKGGKAHRVRRLDSKDYALRALKEIHGLDFDRDREDECDAILLGTAFLWGAPVCDGTDEGGVLTDEMKAKIWEDRGRNVEEDDSGSSEVSVP